MGPFEQKSHKGRRLIGVGALLFFFFLPLHIHFFASALQFNQECSCVYGTRTQAGLVAAPIHWIPTFVAALIIAYEPQALGWISVHFKPTRAPPSIDSL